MAGIKIDDLQKICKTYDLSSKNWFVRKVSDESKFKKEDMILSIDGADVSGLTKSEVHDILEQTERQRVFEVLTWVQQQ